MTPHRSTTPFGPRPLSRAMVVTQAMTGSCPDETIAEKWKVLDDLREARNALNVSDRALCVLNALLTFHQDTTLVMGADLVVFPSNRALSLRANGMADATLRRHLAALVQEGLIIRRDSPNGKRFARRGEGGRIEQAFGFDLSPLVARAKEFETLAEDARTRTRIRYLLREEISLLRRDIWKTIAVALDEGFDGPWAHLTDLYTALGGMPARNADIATLEKSAEELRSLWQEVSKHLEAQAQNENMSGNDTQTERHYQSSKPDPFLDSEKGLRRRLEENAAPEHRPPQPPARAFSLSLILQACPDIAMYTKGGTGISTWRDLITAANVVRPALGISPSAWTDACAIMGEEQASIVLAAILQRAEHIKSAGAYLRSLTERARDGQFSVGPMVMALLRASADALRKTA